MPYRKPVSGEQRRLNAHARRDANWKHWGPYLAERAWGTVREDYSTDNMAWDYFTHEQARSRVYRWNEDGLAGFSDRNQYLCVGLALWNGKDPFLKERLFGLSGPEGNHGEDVKELYWYLDSTPTHSYAQMRYRYPHKAYPYKALIDENAARSYTDREYEISDTGVFDEQRFFDITVTYAKASEDDLLMKIDIHNCSEHSANLSVLPQLWFRNTWSWGYESGPQGETTKTPNFHVDRKDCIACEHEQLGQYHYYWQGTPEVLMTNNESNDELLFGIKNKSPWVKDAFHRYVVNGEKNAVNPKRVGTKTALHYSLRLAGNSVKSIQVRLSKTRLDKPFAGFKPMMDLRRTEADKFYEHLQSPILNDELRAIQRQAWAGMLWSKQLYYYNVEQWLHGDPKLASIRNDPRNSHWQHMDNFDVMSMPDKWEYPWYAVWDTAFHCLPLASVDSDYAKRQLLLLTREWYMHPNGQLPAYEWSFGDVNPPVHAWASWTVYAMEKKRSGKADTTFLESVFHKLLLNFTWWVNRKDTNGNSIFEGGFLGLDNISLFDRSEEPPTGGILHQSDGTAWMGFFSACMLRIALELAKNNHSYENIASKFFEHFSQIARAINGDDVNPGLWNEQDGFFYDHLDLPDGRSAPLRVRSLVGLMPLIATITIEDAAYQEFPDFTRRMNWSINRAPDAANRMANIQTKGAGNRHLLSFMTEPRLRRVLAYLLDEDEFLSPYGIRSLSKFHEKYPFIYITDNGKTHSVGYEPGEGETGMFGGNSNWRGPIWFPINYLIIESLKRYQIYYGSDFTIECPTASGQWMTLAQVADELTSRLVKLFELNAENQRAWCGGNADLLAASNDGMHQFFEYFNGDTGEGLGASHQTGWTGLIALLIQPELQHL